MNAFVAPPAPNGTRSANADWMELQAIRSAGRRSTIGDLLGIIDLIEDQAATVGPFDEETGETLDESILETHRNRPVDAVFGELAAGGYTAGEVVSFGFPRPTGTAFLPALRATYERFGAGTVKKSVPPGFHFRLQRKTTSTALDSSTAGSVNSLRDIGCRRCGGWR